MRYVEKFTNLWKAASTEEVRYAIKGIKLDVSTGVVCATDGHILSVIDAKDELELTDTSHIISVDAWKAAEKARKANKKFTIFIRLENGRTALYAGSDLIQTFPVVEGNFPNYEAVIPKDDEGKHKFIVCLSAKLLLNLSHALRGDDVKEGVSLFVDDANSSVLIKQNSGSYGIIMPIRDSDSDTEPPSAFWRNR